MAVSIHAPGRGATVILQLIVECDEVSIHAPGRGATRVLSSEVSQAEFQFTHPGGVRRGHGH